ADRERGYVVTDVTPLSRGTIPTGAGGTGELLRRISGSEERAVVCAILLPICVTLAGQFIRLTLPRAGFSFVYIPATALVAYVCGRRAGVITGTLSLLLAWRLFIGPGYAFALDATALITLGLYGASLFSVV